MRSTAEVGTEDERHCGVSAPTRAHPRSSPARATSRRAASPHARYSSWWLRSACSWWGGWSLAREPRTVRRAGCPTDGSCSYRSHSSPPCSPQKSPWWRGSAVPHACWPRGDCLRSAGPRGGSSMRRHRAVGVNRDRRRMVGRSGGVGVVRPPPPRCRCRRGAGRVRRCRARLVGVAPFDVQPARRSAATLLHDRVDVVRTVEACPRRHPAVAAARVRRGDGQFDALGRAHDRDSDDRGRMALGRGAGVGWWRDSSPRRPLFTGRTGVDDRSGVLQDPSG